MRNVRCHPVPTYGSSRIKVGYGVTGGKTPDEYMYSALPQVADIARSAFHRITGSDNSGPLSITAIENLSRLFHNLNPIHNIVCLKLAYLVEFEFARLCLEARL